MWSNHQRADQEGIWGSGCCHCRPAGEISRRRFLGGAAASGALTFAATVRADGAPEMDRVCSKPLPPGKPLRVQPALMYHIDQPREKTSWRSYGGLTDPDIVREEAKRIERELQDLKTRAEFPLEIMPLSLIDAQAKARQLAETDAEAILLYAASGMVAWARMVAASKRPVLMFLRHKSGPFYLFYEIAHWRFLRHSGDAFQRRNVDVGDIVVDDYGQLLWRLRALYGLANAKGTTMLAIGGLEAYSREAGRHGPEHAKQVWGYKIRTVRREEFALRLAQARSDPQTVRRAEQQADELLAQPNVTLATERKFVINSFLALEVCKRLMRETGATNFGFASCMGRGVIEMLDTPPCLILSLANDEGYTAYCHADLSHTLPGVLLRWIAGRPTFLCNSHFPHDGVFTVAHCSSPRKMDGKDCEPITIMSHFESDYGAACKVRYSKGQTVSVVIPNLRCSKWQGFRGTILESPSYPACRSQMEIAIDGDCRALAAQMEGFHVQVVYGDYLREVGYALKKLGQVEWQCFSQTQ